VNETREAGGARIWNVVLGLGALAAAWATTSDLFRAGYSPDEEFTLFAVRGIQRHGLPLLPSGLLYDRGLLYSFAAWAASLTGLDILPAARLVSAGAGLGVLTLVAIELRRVTTPAFATLATCLVALSMPFWVSATTARFYTPFMLAYLMVLVLCARHTLTWRGLLALAVASACARWSHELAFTLAGVPVLAGLAAVPERRVLWMFRALAVVTGLLGAQAVIFAVHAMAPPTNGDVMVKRFFLWQVLNLFEPPPLDLARGWPIAAAAGGAVAVALAVVRARVDAWSGGLLAVGGVAAALGQLAVAPVLALAALPLVRARSRRTLVGTGLGVAAAGVAFWILTQAAAGVGVRDAWAALTATAVAYPLDMFDYLVATSPWLVAATFAGLLSRGAVGDAWSPVERSLHLLWIGWVLWFGVIESGITARYLLLPVTFMLAAIAVDAGTRWSRVRIGARPVIAGGAVLVAAMIAVEQWRGPLGGEARAGESRPTLDPAAIAHEIQPDDLVTAHDELAGLLAAGRLDVWLVLDPFFRERFVVRRGGEPTGTYTGAPADDTLAPLLARAEREHRRLIVVDVLKDAPGFGPTNILVPRQLAREDLRGEVLAEGGGVRLLRVVRPPTHGMAALLPHPFVP
jgi:hypothetical protein